MKRDLILDFGAGSSVMLALAAYDGGTTKVKQAVKPHGSRSHQAAQFLVSLPRSRIAVGDPRVCAQSAGRHADRPEPAPLRVLTGVAGQDLIVKTLLLLMAER